MKRSRSGLRLAPALVLSLASACWATACAPRPDGQEPAVLEIEDVGPALDDGLDLSTDRKAAPRTRSGGQLPGHFPEGLPVYKPSTISDLGQGERGDFVQFMSQDGADEIRAWYSAALARAGWSVESGRGEALSVSRGQRRAAISIRTSGPVTLIRVEF